MSWQRLVADVALEVDPATGGLWHREVRCTVPRQSGKTTLLLSATVHRAFAFNGPQRIVYTAQSRSEARAKLEDEHALMLAQSPFAGLFRFRKTNGHEAILWDNGSIHTLMATTKKSGHGKVLDLGIIDEAFSQPDDRLEQAMLPAMMTRDSPQLWVVSTAGTPTDSPYLWSKVEDGRARAESGLDSRVAYFEWSAPEDAEMSDPATWWACMPALGHTVTEAAVQSAYDSMAFGEFCRAYGNQWYAPPKATVIPAEAWARCHDPASVIAGPVVFAADVTPDRGHASIAACGRTATGNRHVEVVDHRPGTDWLVPRLVELAVKWRPRAVVLDPTGPAGSILAPLDQALAKAATGVTVRKVTTTEHAQACAQFYDDVISARVRHRAQPSVTAALAGATRRDLGDGGWAWSRSKTSVDISSLVAITLARWADVSLAPPVLFGSF